jgi:hypothetical protein
MAVHTVLLKVLKGHGQPSVFFAAMMRKLDFDAASTR